MRRPIVDPRFGPLLRHLREERDLSLRALAKRALSSRSQIHDFEMGRRVPSPATAERLDDALGAGGRLMALVKVTPNGELTADDEDRLLHVADNPRRIDPATVDILATMLAGQRRLEDSVGVGPMIAPVATQLEVVRGLVVEARGDLRPRLVDVAGQWAQYAGWLHSAAEQYDQADRLFSDALEWATEAGDVNLVSEVVSMRGHQEWMRGRIGPMIGLSQAAQRDRAAFPGQHAISAAQEARGRAMAGERGEVDRLLDRAVELAGRAAERADDAPPWLYYHSPAFFEIQRGITYRYLGRDDPRANARAVDLLAAGIAGLDQDARATEWAGTHMYHLAVAHVQGGDLQEARVVAGQAWRVAEVTRSKRLRALLSGLEGRLSRDG
jgi:transcriptional regulator with XRE-family HTH domain